MTHTLVTRMRKGQTVAERQASSVSRVCVRRLIHHHDPDSRQRDDGMRANVEPEALWRCNGAKYYDALLGKGWLSPYQR